MASTASANPPPSASHTHTEVAHEPETMESNHDVPATTMADNEDEVSHISDDADTTAAREELQQTKISDGLANHSQPDPPLVDGESVEDKDKDMGGTAKVSTPEQDAADTGDEEMKERLSDLKSPKKKRVRDEEEEDAHELGDEKDETNSVGSPANGDRTTSEPVKKRARDTDSSEDSKSAKDIPDVKLTTSSKTTKPSTTEASKDAPKTTTDTTSTDKPRTSSAAFNASGFAALASAQTTGFGALGASKTSVFVGGGPATSSGFGSLTKSSDDKKPSASGFGALTTNKPSSGFGFGGGSGTTSGFGGLSSGSVFGSKLGNGFGGGSGAKLSSFAAPGAEITGAKPAKAFGAPDSDEEGSDEDGSDEEGGEREEEIGDSPDEKKKPKTIKVLVDDGETGEVTLLQLRAKLFAIESKEEGWKERGVGTLKVNVPRSCAEVDKYTGLPIPGSFDPSGLDEDESEGPRVPRLIMRQENTHRVILNTIIVRGMEFQEKPSTSAVQLLFTAFEGEKELKGINMLLKLSDANARLFRSEMDSIQREL